MTLRTAPLVLVIALASLAGLFAAEAPAGRPPNFIVILTDDQGYADVGAFGAKGFKTPNLDRMAREGRRFTDFYVAQAVCSPSRAAVLTGCYPNRIGIAGALSPGDRHGIHARETTIAQMLKAKNYRTAMFGKWHLGHHPEFLPTRHGFDQYFGLPYSNDMWPLHPEAKPGTYPDLPLIEGEKTIATNPDQSNLTTWYTERAVKFIGENRDNPFFLYVAHNMPHVPLHVSAKFKGKSGKGLYGDVIEEVDWSVGQILDAVRAANLEGNTFVVFVSDNGPWLSYGEHAGSAIPLKEGKGTPWEGGVRVPFIAWWPGKIPAGSVCREPAMTIDLLPTVARLAAAPLPALKIDGLDIWPLLTSDTAKNPHDAYYFYYNKNDLQAVRSGRWKMYVPQAYRTMGAQPLATGGVPLKYSQTKTELALYDLEADVSETTNLAGQRPEVVQRLEALLEAAREDMGDAMTKRVGKNMREAGRLEAPATPAK